MSESLLVNRWFQIQYLFSQRNSLINAVRFPDKSTEAVSIITLEFWKEGVYVQGKLEELFLLHPWADGQV